MGFVLPSGVVPGYARGTRGDFQRRYGTSIGTIDRQGTDLSVDLQAYLNKVARQLNDHVRSCNLKPRQRDLTPVLRRPVEPAAPKRTSADA
jgi:hypothetical protein